jgi:hypothetical protein
MSLKTQHMGYTHEKAGSGRKKGIIRRAIPCNAKNAVRISRPVRKGRCTAGPYARTVIWTPCPP